jgi:hypothetical protein
MQGKRISKSLITLAGVLLSIFVSCRVATTSILPQRTSSITGSEFFRKAAAMNWKQRDSFALQEALSGNMPDFFGTLSPVEISMIDSVTGETIKATLYVTPDYFSIGTNEDWARVPITPMAAQKIADSFHYFLPTRKIVNDIYQAAKVKLEPVPMFAFRDSTPTMYHHHLIIEGQRQGRKGLIAGIKKDVVISGKISRDPKQNRVAIYGWHLLTGKAIQPLYTGHVNWYVDYSHGIRFISRNIKVQNRWMDYEEVLKHPVYHKLICDEEYCDFYKYPY